MNVLILEDEEFTAQRLASQLRTYDSQIQVLATLPSVNKAVHWFTSSPPIWPDLIFLDIQLEDELGFTLINRLNLSIPIIFTTAYDQYTLQAFKANSIDYLLKPIDQAELTAALDKYHRLHSLSNQTRLDQRLLTKLIEQLAPPAYRDRFMVSVGTKLRSIPSEAIAYFFYDHKITYLMPHEGSAVAVDYSYSLDKLSDLLNPAQFFRVNRTFLVAASAITLVHTYSGSKLKLDLHPQPRQDVFVSIDRVTSFKAWFGR